MKDIKPYPILDCVVNLIKNAIDGAKVENVSPSVVIIKDGNDTIKVEHRLDSGGNTATILIDDPKDIIYSEDLLPLLERLQDNTTGELKAGLQAATLIINGLNAVTRMIFQAVKDGFDVISNSYEFTRTIQSQVTKVSSTVKFGKHLFGLTLSNEPNQILLTPEFPSKVDPEIKTVIEKDALKVQHAVNEIYKKEKPLKDA